MVMSIAFVLGALYLGVAGLLYAYQRDFLYFPDVQRPVATPTAVPAFKEVELVTADGLRLLAWYVPPPEGRPVLLYFHGNGGHVGYRWYRLSRFVAAGYGVLMPEYRGYGGNEGQPSEAAFFADSDVAMAFLQKEGLSPDRIVVYGESLGTGVATRVASENQIAALVLEAPYTSISAMAGAQFPYLPVSLMLKDRFDSLSRIVKVRAPILVMQGERDQVVPPALGQELFAAASEPKEFWSTPDGGHDDLFDFGADEAAVDFIERRVPAAF
jgi:fermentation-respiration switch protein FrsA (DUF1100 family)